MDGEKQQIINKENRNKKTKTRKKDRWEGRWPLQCRYLISSDSSLTLMHNIVLKYLESNTLGWWFASPRGRYLTTWE